MIRHACSDQRPNVQTRTATTSPGASNVSDRNRSCPTDVELFPPTEGRDGCVECFATLTQSNARTIDCISWRRRFELPSCVADKSIGEIHRALASEKVFDRRVIWFSQSKHNASARRTGASKDGSPVSGSSCHEVCYSARAAACAAAPACGQTSRKLSARVPSERSWRDSRGDCVDPLQCGTPGTAAPREDASVLWFSSDLIGNIPIARLRREMISF